MRLQTLLLTTLTTLLPVSLAAPAAPAAPSDPNYQCGYVLTKPNANVHAGLSALESCTPFFYNDTVADYQDAYAYKLFGGCECGFYASAGECEQGVGSLLEGPSAGKYWETVGFEEPRPKWYECFRV